QSGVFRWREAEDALAGNFSTGAIDSLAVDEESMISDLHGSPAYRSHLVKVLTARAVTAA
ncbi:MAG: carbon monoxide dehydrogenase, partial [Rhodobacteraceae bacterium]|nr:carbon monoxide dehydrogenase [Paracoccaceae bacterium]